MFHSMQEASAEDWKVIRGVQATHTETPLAERVIQHLLLLGEDKGGFAVSRVTHSLQSATRAARAGRNDEYVLCALLHDLGDTIGKFDHGVIAAAVVQPFVAPKLRWMVEYHAEFQGYYFYEHFGMDKDKRERHRGHEYFDLTQEFVDEYDALSFDPTYPTEPIEYFRPLVHDLMAAPRYGSGITGALVTEGASA